MNAAIYARYSTDKQTESSLADQIRLCRVRAQSEQIEVTIEHKDDGISGSTPVGSRPGGASLLADALAGRFSVLLVEGLDRLSRDSVEQEQIIRRLEYRGIRIVGVSDGYDSRSAARKLHRGMRGLINEIYLDDLRAKTHRGLTGQVERGLFAGGISYGYRSVVAGGGHQLEIDLDEAKWVVWIYERFATGLSPRRIVHELNRQKVPSPRGGAWAVSALYGSPAKGTGILNNELYSGTYIWNRSQWIKDPDTGIRKRVERPRHEWLVKEYPQLRIVPEELWQKVRSRLDSPRNKGGCRGKGQRPKTLLGGLLTCSRCGGAMVAVDARRYGCVARHDKGTCDGIFVRRQATDAQILATLQDDLLSPSFLSMVQNELDRLAKDRRRESADTTVATSKRMAELKNETRNLADAIAACGLSEALRTRLAETEAEYNRLKATPETRDATATIQQVTKVLEDYRRLLADLPSTFARRPHQAREAIRDVLGEISLVKDGDTVWAEIEEDAGRVLLAAGMPMGVVAGARLVLPLSAKNAFGSDEDPPKHRECTRVFTASAIDPVNDARPASPCPPRLRMIL